MSDPNSPCAWHKGMPEPKRRRTRFPWFYMLAMWSGCLAVNIGISSPDQIGPRALAVAALITGVAATLFTIDCWRR
jgi:hypothetical protein